MPKIVKCRNFAAPKFCIFTVSATSPEWTTVSQMPYPALSSHGSASWRPGPTSVRRHSQTSTPQREEVAIQGPPLPRLDALLLRPQNYPSAPVFSFVSFTFSAVYPCSHSLLPRPTRCTSALVVKPSPGCYCLSFLPQPCVLTDCQVL